MYTNSRNQHARSEDVSSETENNVTSNAAQSLFLRSAKTSMPTEEDLVRETASLAVALERGSPLVSLPLKVWYTANAEHWLDTL